MEEDQRTFGSQKHLPPLPVPDLDATCNKLIDWVRPLLDSDSWHRTQSTVEAFRRPGGEGEILQDRLLQWARQKDLPNWLESFWDEKYLKSRIPIPINVNFSTVCDHTMESGKLDWIQRSALLSQLTLQFKSLLEEEALLVDRIREQPLCMAQFKGLFSATRIPRRGMDAIRNPVSRFYPTSRSEKHILVLHNGHIFSMTVMDGQGGGRKTLGRSRRGPADDCGPKQGRSRKRGKRGCVDDAGSGQMGGCQDNAP